MYVVGAIVLRAFWNAHPHCEAELRALYALLSEGTADGFDPMFAASGEFDAGKVMIELSQTRVSLDVNRAAQIVKVSDVSLREVD